MAIDPRAALDRLIAALEAHLEVAARERSEDSEAVTAATTTLIDAFETYDEALYEAYDVDTPFVVYDDSEDDEEFEEEDYSDDDLETPESEDLEEDEDFLVEDEA